MKGIDDNQDLEAEITYQDKMMSLGNFLIELKSKAKKKDNIERSSKAVKELTEIALYVNNLEVENMAMKMEMGFKKSKVYNQIIKLLKQCLKS